MLNRELEVTLNLAFKEARAKRHEFMTVEHLLLALLDNEAAATVLRACGANLDKLRRDLQEFIDSTTPLIPQHDDERETQPTLGFQRVLQRAVFHVQSSGKREVTGANVLVALSARAKTLRYSALSANSGLSPCSSARRIAASLMSRRLPRLRTASSVEPGVRVP